MTEIISWIVETLVGIAFAVPLLIIRAIGLVTPACGDTPTFMDEIIYMMTNGIRFLWPVLQWVPFAICWKLIQYYIVYFVFKFVMSHIKGVITWLTTMIGKVIP